MEIRLADPGRDGEAVAAIYRPAVEASGASFEDEAPSADEMGRRIATTLRRTPWYVAVEDAEVVGYAYARAHRERAGYRWSADISAYVAKAHQGMGVGKQLYATLLGTLRDQRFVNAYAGVVLPNAASVALHESIGMTLVGVYRRVGFRLGEWRDVAWYELRLAEPKGDPPEPIPLPDLLAATGRAPSAGG